MGAYRSMGVSEKVCNAIFPADKAYDFRFVDLRCPFSAICNGEVASHPRD
jgi:hypothetical protein